MRTDPLGQSGDIFNNAFDADNYLVDSPDNRNVLPLWKQYVRGYVACHFHLRTTVGGEVGHSYDLCADFQVLRGVLDEVHSLETLSVFKGSSFKGQYSAPNKDWCQQLVFISVGRVAEDTKDALSIPSLVRLRRVDDCPLRTRDFAKSFPLLENPLASILNRELNPSSLPARLGHSNVAQMQLPEQVVEGAAEVVNNISYDDAHLETPVLWDCCDAKDVSLVLGSRSALSWIWLGSP